MPTYRHDTGVRQARAAIAYALRWLIPAAAIAAIAALVASLLDDDEELADRTRQQSTAPVLPRQRVVEVRRAAALARCRLVKDGDTRRRAERERGRRALDAAYEERPPAAELARAIDAGRVVIEYRPRLAPRRRAQLRALFTERSRALVVAPARRQTRADLIALSNRASLTCARFNERTFDALRAFHSSYARPEK